MSTYKFLTRSCRTRVFHIIRVPPPRIRKPGEMLGGRATAACYVETSIAGPQQNRNRLEIGLGSRRGKPK